MRLPGPGQEPRESDVILQWGFSPGLEVFKLRLKGHTLLKHVGKILCLFSPFCVRWEESPLNFTRIRGGTYDPSYS